MNKVILIGNFARDPELRTTQAGISRCLFTLAVNRRFNNQQGEREADFINCVAWRGTADFVSKYFVKGKKAAVVGSLQTRSYEGQDGQKKYITEVVVDDIEFVESRSASQAPQSEGGYSSQPERPRQSAPAQPSDSFAPVDDDELPF